VTTKHRTEEREAARVDREAVSRKAKDKATALRADVTTHNGW
jgi:hypothetical protein